MVNDTVQGASPPLEARGIAASYGRAPILQDVSLLAHPGQLTVLAGPNGSGKSTLLSVMSRVLQPSGGCVLLDGKAIADLRSKEIARRLGLLPQAPLVPEGLTVYELVSRGRYPHQGILKQWRDEDEKAVVSALAVTGTQGLADRQVDSLSGGQRQRCFIAMTLAQETPVLLFDEPTTFLDLRYQAEIMDLIASLSRDHGRAVVAVLHDLNSALQYADRIAFLKNGRIHRILESANDCTAELISEIFETQLVRVEHPISGRPAFLGDARTSHRVAGA